MDESPWLDSSGKEETPPCEEEETSPCEEDEDESPVACSEEEIVGEDEDVGCGALPPQETRRSIEAMLKMNLNFMD